MVMPLTPDMSDAQWLAAAAVQAFEQGRYALGVELGRLAQRAPGSLNAAAAAAKASIFGPDSTGPAVRMVSMAGATRTEHPAERSHAPSTCTRLLETHGSRSVCGEPVQWAAGAGWHHTDSRTDNDHQADPATY